MKKRPTRALEVVRRAAEGKRSGRKKPKRRAAKSTANRRINRPAPQLKQKGHLFIPIAELSPAQKKNLDELTKIFEQTERDLRTNPQAPSARKSRYGLEKAFLVRGHENFPSKSAERWQRIADRYDGQLMDALNAFEHGIIDQKTLDSEMKKIGAKFRAARKKVDDAIRAAYRKSGTPRPPVQRNPQKRKTPRRRR